MNLRVALIIATLLPLTFAAFPAGSPTPAQGSLNFSEHIAPIVFNRCATCHRPGEAAPFSLLSYEDVRKRGKLIASVTQSRYMPPWLGDSGMGSFRDDRRLTEAEIRTIQEWVQAGMPEGDPRKMTKAPTFTPGWQLGEPDLIVKMGGAVRDSRGWPGCVSKLRHSTQCKSGPMGPSRGVPFFRKGLSSRPVLSGPDRTSRESRPGGSSPRF